MRLTPDQAEAIREEVLRMDPDAEVFLFGSRANDAARGGDVDLWVRSSRIGYAEALCLKVRIKDRIGWQKVDLVVNRGEDDPLAALVSKTAIRL